MRLAAALVGLCLLAPPAWAAPVIRKATGAVVNGAALTLTGTGFGTKAVAAPLKFDRFESGKTGSVVSNGWALTEGHFRPGVPHFPVYSTAVLRPNSTRSVQARFDDDGRRCGGDGCQSGSSFGIRGMPSPGFTHLYLDAWVYYAIATPVESRNVKLLRVHAYTDDQPNLYLNIYCLNDTDGARLGQDGGGNSTVLPATPWRGASFFAGNWRHIQLYLVQSSPNQLDGLGVLTIDNVTSLKESLRTRVDTSTWDTVWMGNYVGHDRGPPSCPHPSPFSTFIYWDDAYVDTTQARVEIGDAATYTACTEREIQPATSWSPTSVTVTANQGAFASLAGKYVFVVDRTGAASNGLQISSADTPPARAPATKMTVSETGTPDRPIAKGDSVAPPAKPSEAPATPPKEPEPVHEPVSGGARVVPAWKILSMLGLIGGVLVGLILLHYRYYSRRGH